MTDLGNMAKLYGLDVIEDNMAYKQHAAVRVIPWRRRWWKPWDCIETYYWREPLCFQVPGGTVPNHPEPFIVAHPDIIAKLKERTSPLVDMSQLA